MCIPFATHDTFLDLFTPIYTQFSQLKSPETLVFRGSLHLPAYSGYAILYNALGEHSSLFIIRINSGITRILWHLCNTVNSVNSAKNICSLTYTSLFNSRISSADAFSALQIFANVVALGVSSSFSHRLMSFW